MFLLCNYCNGAKSVGNSVALHFSSSLEVWRSGESGGSCYSSSGVVVITQGLLPCCIPTEQLATYHRRLYMYCKSSTSALTFSYVGRAFALRFTDQDNTQLAGNIVCRCHFHIVRYLVFHGLSWCDAVSVLRAPSVGAVDRCCSGPSSSVKYWNFT